MSLAAGQSVDWMNGRFTGSVPDVSGLLRAAHAIAGAPVDIVAVDMPVATTGINGRRVADNRVSAAYGGRGCSTHSPGPNRPGGLGAAFSRDFAASGYPVAHAETPPGTHKSLVEIYPHPAILTLLGRAFRVPYKVAKSRRYWPGLSVSERIVKLVGELTTINEALSNIFGATAICIPEPDSVRSLAFLKRYEDALDALVSAWVGVCYAEGRVQAYGDHQAAIWCPQ
jgi:predicted RNase H-like nuclease